MAISVRIEGLKELRDVLDRFPEIAIPYVDTAIKNSIYTILRKTNPYIPVNTGRLARSFPAGIQFRALYGEMESNVEYATAIHNLYPVGKPYHNPSKNTGAVAGFLDLGIRTAVPEIEDEFTRALDEIMRKLGD